MLELYNINAGYGDAQVLRDISLQVNAGEILCLMGRNGAGKTTTLKTIMGVLSALSGEIRVDGAVVSALAPHLVPLAGVGYVPQGRRLFAGLTVAQNLEVGLRARNSGPDIKNDVLELFPRLKERLNQPAQTLSGGEQQMLATARALCIRPKVLLLDEPTEGLQPSIIETIQTVTVKMRAQGVAILLVEQRIDAVLELADRVAFIENGRNGQTLDIADLKNDRAPFETYLGV